MENLTTPIKATVCGLIAAKLVVLLGMGEADASAAAAGVWAILTASLALIVPHDLGTRIGGWIGKP